MSVAHVDDEVSDTEVYNTEKLFCNGDKYIGQWGTDTPHGNGKYVWSDGCIYLGDWNNGKIHGNGKFTWPSGATYEGEFKNGFMDGEGTFTNSINDTYIGSWVMNNKQGKGETIYANGEHNEGEKISVFPSDKVFYWSNEEGNVQKPPTKSNDGHDGNATEKKFFGGSLKIRLQPGKRQGVTISKGHKNYELMLNLQLGIRHSVGRPITAKSLKLKPTAFDTEQKLWTRFPPHGSKHTPPHHSCEFKWKDYCPMVFRALRKLFNVDPADYMLSICGNDALRELSSPGKSGSFFYLTHDDKYMIKTMKKSEVKVLKRMLPTYYEHVNTFENTLVTKFFGLHCVKISWPIQRKVRFVIMGNLLCTEVPIHRRYDLKGSSLGRITDKPETEIDANTTLKDLDLKFIFRLQKDQYQEFCSQVNKDCDFLEQERIMDYSLLVGVSFQEPDQQDCEVNAENDSNETTPSLSTDMDSTKCSCSRLGIKMPARVEFTVRSQDTQLVGDPTGKFGDVIIFFGIIDILQDYDMGKKIEHAYKSFQYDSTSISAVDPKLYSKRFKDFIFKVFSDDG